MTEEPIVEHDYSAAIAAHEAEEQRVKDQHAADIEAQLAPARSQARLDEAMAEATILKAQGERRLRTGGAVFAGLAGVAAIIAALSLWHRVEIVRDVQTVYLDRPVATAAAPAVPYAYAPVAAAPLAAAPAALPPIAVPPAAAPAPAPAALPQPAPMPAKQRHERRQDLPPQPQQQQEADAAEQESDILPRQGMAISDAQFRKTAFFREAPKCHGKLLSHVSGQYRFDDGTSCYDSDAFGNVDPSSSNPMFNGDTVACRLTGNVFASGQKEKQCLALHNGVLEDVFTAMKSGIFSTPTRAAATRTKPSSIFDELFN